MKHIIIITVLVLLIAACDPNPELSCQQGTQGVVVSFGSTTDISNVRAGESNPAIVEIANKGAYPASGVARITYNEDLLSMEPREIPFELEGGAAWNRCEGTLTRNQTSIEPFELPPTASHLDQEIRIDACYRYENNLSTQLCISPLSDVVSATEQACSPARRGFSGGQGGPLSVVRIDPVAVYDDSDGTQQVRVAVYLENHGDGEIIVPRTPNADEQACTFGQSFSNFVYAKAFLDNYRLSCSTMPSPGDRPDGDKAFLRYDPEVIENRGETETLRRYYLECVGPVETDASGNILPDAQNPDRAELDLDEALTMTFDLHLDYFYRDTTAEVKQVRVRRI